MAEETSLKIRITTGIGTGLTELSAFDAALYDAGIANFNLIYLSSIVPPASSVNVEKYTPQVSEFGSKLYVVMSKMVGSNIGDALYAGLGWVYSVHGGIFVEHSGSSYNQVAREIDLSIESMIQSRPHLATAERHQKIVGVDNILKPTCVLVAAVFASESW